MVNVMRGMKRQRSSGPEAGVGEYDGSEDECMGSAGEAGALNHNGPSKRHYKNDVAEGRFGPTLGTFQYAVSHMVGGLSKKSTKVFLPVLRDMFTSADVNELAYDVSDEQRSQFLVCMRTLHGAGHLTPDHLWYASAFFMTFEASLKTELNDILTLVNAACKSCDDAWLHEYSAVLSMPLKKYANAVNGYSQCLKTRGVDKAALSVRFCKAFEAWAKSVPVLDKAGSAHFLKHFKSYLSTKEDVLFSVLRNAARVARRDTDRTGRKAICAELIKHLKTLDDTLDNYKGALSVFRIMPEKNRKYYDGYIRSLYEDLCERAVSTTESASHKEKIAAILEKYKPVFSQMLSGYIRELPDGYKDSPEYKLCKTQCDELENRWMEGEIGAPGFHFMMPAFEACLGSPSLHFKDKAAGQLTGDAYERLYWMMTGLHQAVVKDTAAVCLWDDGLLRDDRAALKMLERVYGEEWVEKQQRIHAFCKKTRMPYAFDLDTHANANTWPAMLSSTACMSYVVGQSMGNSNAYARTGLVLVRPPGHHHDDEGAGFCMSNYVAVEAIEQARAGKSVVVIDLDVHSGNGTQALILKAIAETPEIADRIRFINLFQQNNYPYSARDTYGKSDDKKAAKMSSAIIDCPYDIGTTGTQINDRLNLELETLKEAGFTPDLALYSLGIDSHSSDILGGAKMKAADFATAIKAVDTVFEKERVPVVAAVEGGYKKSAITSTIAAASEALTELSHKPIARRGFMRRKVILAPAYPDSDSDGSDYSASHCS
jgi:acetoin utilization deacetylase AcuC-like enzyme